MPRNSVGVYSLPTGINPVVPLTTITSSWANPTMLDLANALTDSLSRSGLGGMTAPFRLADGTVAAPGLSFTNEPGLGFYRPAGPGIGAFATGGIEAFRFDGGKVTFNIATRIYKEIGIKFPTVKSWLIDNGNDGILRISPSVTVGAEDWDQTRGLAINSLNGDVYAYKGFQANGNAGFLGTMTVNGVAVFNSNLTVNGAFRAEGSGFVGGTLTVGAVSSVYDVSSSSQIKGRSFTHNAIQFPGLGLAGNVTLDYNTSQVFITGIAAAGTVSFANIPPGGMMRVFVSNFYGGFITWAGVVWAVGTPNPIQGGPGLRGIITVTNDGAGLMGTLSQF